MRSTKFIISAVFLLAVLTACGGGAPKDPVAAFDNAVRLAGQGKLQEAIEAYKEVLKIAPRMAPAYINMGNCYYKLDRGREALAAYDMAIGIDPGNPVVYYNKANMLYRLGMFKEAVAAYDKAVGLNPGYTEAYLNRSVTLRRLGRDKESAASFDMAERLKKNVVRPGGVEK